MNTNTVTIQIADGVRLIVSEENTHQCLNYAALRDAGIAELVFPSKIFSDGDECYRNYTARLVDGRTIYGRLYGSSKTSYARLNDGTTAWMADISTEKLKRFLSGEITAQKFSSYIEEKYDDIQRYYRDREYRPYDNMDYDPDAFERRFWAA